MFFESIVNGEPDPSSSCAAGDEQAVHDLIAAARSARPKPRLRPDEAGALRRGRGGRSFGARFRMLADETVRARPARRRRGAARERRPLPRCERTASRRCCSSARRWATRAGASPASRSPPSARCALGAALRGARAAGPRASPRVRHIVHGLLGDLGLEHRGAALEHRARPIRTSRAGRSRTARRRRAELRAGGDGARRADRARRPLAIVPVGRIAERALRDLGVAALPSRAASRQRRRDRIPRRAALRLRRCWSARLRLVGPRIAGSPCGASRLRSMSASAMNPSTRVRHDDDCMGADREARAGWARWPRREHDHDQRLLRAHPARRQRQERRERADHDDQQRIPECPRGCRTPRSMWNIVPTRQSQPSALREDDLDDEAARLVQDREALAHALAEVAGDLHRVAQQQEREQDERRDDQARRRAGAGPPRDSSKAGRMRQVGQARHARPACTRR